MQLCDTDKGVSCYTFYFAGLLQIVISTYFSIICLKALQSQALLASKYPRITRKHFLKLLTLLAIIVIEILGLIIAFQRTQEELIDASELFNFVINIMSDFICAILLRKEFTTIKQTSGYLRSYIFLSFFVYTIVMMINAFNNKSNSFGLSSDQIIYILSLISKSILTAEVFIFKSDLTCKKSPSTEDDINITQDQMRNNDDLYFALQDQHIEIDSGNGNRNIQSNQIQIVYQEIIPTDSAQIYYSKQKQQQYQHNNDQSQKQAGQLGIRTQGQNKNNQASQIWSDYSNQQHLTSSQLKNKNNNLGIRSSHQFQDSNTSFRDSFNPSNSITSGMTISHNVNGPYSQITNREQVQINHVLIKEIYNLNGVVMIKIQVKFINGQSGELNKTLTEFQQIATFIRNYFKHEDQDLMEIEGIDLNLRFNSVQDEESLMKKLEKVMNLIITNNFHTNTNISKFFKYKSASNINYDILPNNEEESVVSSYNNQYLVDKGDNCDYLLNNQQNSVDINGKSLQSNINKMITSNTKTSYNDKENNQSEDFTQNNENTISQESEQVSISIKSLNSSINDETNGQDINESSPYSEVIIKVNQITAEYMPKEDYTKYLIKLQYFTNNVVKDFTLETRYKEILTIHNNIKVQLPKIEIPELPNKEKTFDFLKSKTDQDVIDFRKKTLPSYFETILNNEKIKKLDFIREMFFSSKQIFKLVMQ